jgi:hypothetical protein
MLVNHQPTGVSTEPGRCGLRGHCLLPGATWVLSDWIGISMRSWRLGYIYDHIWYHIYGHELQLACQVNLKLHPCHSGSVFGWGWKGFAPWCQVVGFTRDFVIGSGLRGSGRFRAGLAMNSSTTDAACTRVFTGDNEDPKEYKRWKVWIQNKSLTLGEKVPESARVHTCSHV